MEATEIAISNPLLENNSMKGAKAVLINVTCSDDTSLHDIDLAINRVQEESDEDANIIWGVQKDESLNGKFKISVISTGIDCENYYKDIKNEQNTSKIDELSKHSERNIIIDESVSENNLNSDEIKQTSFFVDLQQTTEIKKPIVQEEKKNIDENNSDKKTSFFSKIFGLNRVKREKAPEIDEQKPSIINEESTSRENSSVIEQFVPSPQEPLDQTELDEVDESISFEVRNQSNNNEKDEDLLQIPAFLRRQAN